MHVKSHNSFGIRPEKKPSGPSSRNISLIDDQIELYNEKGKKNID